MRKLYGTAGDGWVLGSQLHTAINDALVEGGGKPISRQMFYKTILGQVEEKDKEKRGHYLYVRADQVDRWVRHAELRLRKIANGEWLARHAWGDDTDESFRVSKAGAATVVVLDGAVDGGLEAVVLPDGAVLSSESTGS